VEEGIFQIISPGLKEVSQKQARYWSYVKVGYNQTVRRSPAIVLLGADPKHP
jgi:hypothetical protein